MMYYRYDINQGTEFPPKSELNFFQRYSDSSSLIPIDEDLQTLKIVGIM